ncbi:GNAT family N-acetyltransferase [Saliphagus infecundisoli]|uniref:GNAT family N-acetyltransferase n=1 Tax=Saliphagus infecundisoli TaxID=1849069 RepID=A0ABD5QG50_9EURY|nr:GNAT family N-acetyltransferase [Saliphagus infecundisoli]
MSGGSGRNSEDGVAVREAVLEDGEAIRAVHRESILGLGPAAYDDEQVAAWAAGCADADYVAGIEGEEPFLVATDGDEIVGFGSLSVGPPEDYAADVDCEVTGVYVHPADAGRGVGSRLLAALEERAREAGVSRLGLTASANAVGFYESRGYERVRAYRHEFSAARSTGVTGRVVEMKRRF